MKVSNDQRWHKLDAIFLSLLLVLALSLRLYNIHSPLANYHSSRQADTAAVARNFVRDGFDLREPQSDNTLKGYKISEFSLYSAIFALEYKVFPFAPLEVWGRLTSIFFSLISIAILYYFALKEFGRFAAVSTAIIYSIFPFFVFFSRIILPETMVVALALTGLFILYRLRFNYSSQKRFSLELLSAFFFTLAILVQGSAIFYLIPAIYLFIFIYKKSLVKHIGFYVFLVTVFLPFFLWHLYTFTSTEGIPTTKAVAANLQVVSFKNIFLGLDFLRLIFYDRIANIILGGYGIFFLLSGILRKQKTLFTYVLVGASFCYLFILEKGNAQYENYQIFILPAIALLCGSGLEYVLFQKRKWNSIIPSTLLTGLVFVFSLAFSFYQVRGYYSYPNNLMQYAKIINTLTAPDDLIVTQTGGDTTLLYLSDRKGAPSPFTDVIELKQKGYAYIVALDKKYASDIAKNYGYSPLFHSDNFALFKL